MLGRASEWRGDGAPSPEATARALRLAEALAPGARAELLASDPPAPTGDASLAAPVRRADGSVVAILRLTELPSPPDPSLAERLQDVADLLASAFGRVGAVAAEPSADTARATMAAVIEAAPLSMALTDRDLRVLAVSPTLIESLGWHDREVVGESLFDLSPAVFERWRDTYRAVLGGEERASRRFPMRDLQGRPAWYEGHVRTWKRADGEAGGLIIAWHDITGMMEALERTARSEDRLKLAMEISEMHVWEMDYRRKELIKVGAEDTFFDAPVTFEMLAEDIYGNVDERDLMMVREAWRRHFREGAPYHPEYRLKRKDGQEVWTACTLKLINDDQGRPLRLIGAMQNITARKRAEKQLLQAKDEAEAANQAKSTFLATMSHEIRTPLNGVLGMAQAMAADTLAPDQRARLDVIRQSGESLLAILNDVLDLSKIEAGKLELEEVDFDLGGMVRDVLAAFEAVARGRGLPLALEVEPAAEGLYRGDPVRVRQILSNLVSNALKFTEEGSVAVRMDGGGQGVRLTVRDTGIGMPPDRLGRLFQKFEQAEASTTRRFGGTGLGLSICRELTELMGGAIKVDSQPGAGTEFQVFLPLPRLGEAPSEAAPTAPQAAPADGPPLRILAAEDNPVNQLVLTTLLEQAGLSPRVVDSGRKAVEAWETGDWDVILMDVQMPDMDGPEATRAIRAREAETRRPRTPILALTANAMSHQEAEYLASGMDAVIAKPIQVERLFEALRQALEAAPSR
ncbi:MAG: ATP-binding protein [Phenylobacterium sp.]|uniref:ATP-binding protein n=1 Tax=Phenylobacterium sp. TaxID=1871053 RepID=UPI002A35C593|nr:ATP-binding protein [Phenylobacterium sp.]MDX9998454.1 ATP-binding protein [Phenylobacterium sp.]